MVNATAVLFPVDLDSPFNGLVYTVPASVSQHLITGLEPNGRYDVVIETVSSDVQITIMPGGNYQADEGGVLVVGDSLSTQTIYLPLLQQSN